MLAVLAHLTPVTALLALARGDGFARAHGRAALRFQLSLAVYLAAIVGLELIRGRLVVAVQLGAVPALPEPDAGPELADLRGRSAIHRAATGHAFTYPMTIGRT